MPATIDLNSDSADHTDYGDDNEDFSGSSVAAGDIDGDTTDDLIIGAYAADPAGGATAGETYVIYGGPPAFPVGGIAELPEVSDSAGRNYIALAGLAAAVLAALTVGGWYARRRWLA
ncbi:MAG: FG-GAP repeat protein [Dehalococcoidia bacterium]|nr:MAG: FG-GAP repeat protein [Dehalococcoidia bacterium]